MCSLTSVSHASSSSTSSTTYATSKSKKFPFCSWSDVADVEVTFVPAEPGKDKTKIKIRPGMCPNEFANVLLGEIARNFAYETRMRYFAFKSFPRVFVAEQGYLTHTPDQPLEITDKNIVITEGSKVYFSPQAKLPSILSESPHVTSELRFQMLLLSPEFFAKYIQSLNNPRINSGYLVATKKTLSEGIPKEQLRVAMTFHSCTPVPIDDASSSSSKNCNIKLSQMAKVLQTITFSLLEIKDIFCLSSTCKDIFLNRTDYNFNLGKRSWSVIYSILLQKGEYINKRNRVLRYLPHITAQSMRSMIDVAQMIESAKYFNKWHAVFQCIKTLQRFVSDCGSLNIQSLPRHKIIHQKEWKNWCLYICPSLDKNDLWASMYKVISDSWKKANSHLRFFARVRFYEEGITKSLFIDELYPNTSTNELYQRVTERTGLNILLYQNDALVPINSFIKNLSSSALHNFKARAINESWEEYFRKTYI